MNSSIVKAMTMVLALGITLLPFLITAALRRSPRNGWNS